MDFLLLTEDEVKLLELLAVRSSKTDDISRWFDFRDPNYPSYHIMAFCNICKCEIEDPYQEIPYGDLQTYRIVMHGKQHLKDSGLLVFL